MKYHIKIPRMSNFLSICAPFKLQRKIASFMSLSARACSYRGYREWHTPDEILSANRQNLSRDDFCVRILGVQEGELCATLQETDNELVKFHRFI